MTSLGDLSWRKFIIYLRGFSQDSATVAKLSSQRMIGSSKKVNEVAGAKATQRAFEALFKTSPVKPTE